MRSRGILAAVAVAVGWLVALGSLARDAHAALGPAPVDLGAADGFAVMAGTTVTSADSYSSTLTFTTAPPAA